MESKREGQEIDVDNRVLDRLKQTNLCAIDDKSRA